MGKRDVLELMLLGVLADGHVLIEDNPGLAKTLMARSFAAVTGLRFARVQFTPDLMPSDVTGSAIFDQRSELRFQPGPIFTNVLLGDEINRARRRRRRRCWRLCRSARSQARTAPARSSARSWSWPPRTRSSTRGHPLPEAQLDRFLLRIHVGYPDRPAELELLARRLGGPGRGRLGYGRRSRRAPGDAAGSRARARRFRDPGLRGRPRRRRVRAPRSRWAPVPAAPWLCSSWRGRGGLDGRDYVTPDDVKRIAVPALAHRIALRPELWIQRVDPEDVVRECLDGCPAPPVRVRDEAQ